MFLAWSIVCCLFRCCKTISFVLLFVYVPDETRITLLHICMENISLDKNINFTIVSDKLEGYTCSDIANVCRDAAMMCMRRKIQGQTPLQIKQIRKSLIDLPVTMEDFLDAISRCKKSVTSQDVARYQTWMGEFGSY